MRLDDMPDSDVSQGVLQSVIDIFRNTTKEKFVHAVRYGVPNLPSGMVSTKITGSRVYIDECPDDGTKLKDGLLFFGNSSSFYDKSKVRTPEGFSYEGYLSSGEEYAKCPKCNLIVVRPPSQERIDDFRKGFAETVRRVEETSRRFREMASMN